MNYGPLTGGPADKDRENPNALPPLTGRFLTLAALAYALILIGLLVRSGALVAVAIPLVVYMGATLLHRPPALQLSVERSLTGDTVASGKPVTVTLSIHNDGEDLDELMVTDRVPHGLEVLDGKSSVLTSLPKGGTVELRYTVRAARGSFNFLDLQVSASEHLGVMRRRGRLYARRNLTYLPEVTRLRRVAIRPPRTHGHFGPIPSRQAATGIDFYGLREYQMGDPQRWINWRTSARHEQQLFVNQFEQERIADVGIILDARAQTNIEAREGQSLFEYSVQAAGSLSQALLDDGNRVGLLVYGFGMERVFPGYGKVQQERILYALGGARTGHNFALESLGYLPTRFFPAGCQIVMISPLLQSDAPAFTQLRACGYEVMLVSPDPVDFEARALNVQGDLAHQIARVESALLLRRLQRLGIRILDWQVHRPFEPLVRAMLSRPAPGPRVRVIR